MNEAQLLEALRTALEAAPRPIGDPGFTVNELCREWKLSEKTVRNRLRPLVESGAVKLGHARRKKLDGIEQAVPVYRVA